MELTRSTVAGWFAGMMRGWVLMKRPVGRGRGGDIGGGRRDIVLETVGVGQGRRPVQDDSWLGSEVDFLRYRVVDRR